MSAADCDFGAGTAKLGMGFVLPGGVRNFDVVGVLLWSSGFLCGGLCWGCGFGGGWCIL